MSVGSWFCRLLQLGLDQALGLSNLRLLAVQWMFGCGLLGNRFPRFLSENIGCGFLRTIDLRFLSDDVGCGLLSNNGLGLVQRILDTVFLNSESLVVSKGAWIQFFRK